MKKYKILLILNQTIVLLPGLNAGRGPTAVFPNRPICTYIITHDNKDIIEFYAVAETEHRVTSPPPGLSDFKYASPRAGNEYIIRIRRGPICRQL